ncbi:glycosyltransferase [Pseudomonas sp. D1-3]
MKVALDASRNRSGGARAHLIGILTDGDPRQFGIEEVHVWSYKALLDRLPDRSWLIKHSHPHIEKGLLWQIFWQRFLLKHEVRREGCHVLLSTDAGTVCRFTPSVVMSRDMLSFEPREMSRFNWTVAWLRLYLLRYMQVASLKSAAGQLFLTNYAAQVITRFLPSHCASQVRVIPHGVSEAFRGRLREPGGSSDVVCICVSNADLYKHQWNVVKAVAALRQEGFNIKLNLLGAGAGRPAAVDLVLDALKKFDPNQAFTELHGAVAHSDIATHLKRSDLFIFSSSCENMPNTLIEGMASGLPILCSDRGPMPEVLKDGGMYFDPENVESLISSLRQMLLSPAIRHELSKRSRSYSDDFSWARCSKETWQYLVDVSNAAKKGQ